MKNDGNSILFDEMQLDGEYAWAGGTKLNALFKIDLNSGQCQFVTDFIDYDLNNFRKNQICRKCKDDVFCFPDFGSSIWVYNTKDKQLNSIPVDCDDGVRIGIFIVVEGENQLFAVSQGLNKIFEVDIQTKKIIERHEIVKGREKIETSESSVMVDGKLYFVIVDTGNICEFDLVSKKIQLYSIFQEDQRIYTICHDGHCFWMSGRTRELFRWDKTLNQIQAFDCFPSDFGRYYISKDNQFSVDYSKEYVKPIFCHCVCLPEEIWFIPFDANMIIYIDRNNYAIHSFHVMEEYEDGEARINGAVKYRLEYVRDNRFICLYSYKHQKYMEIDTVNKTIKYKNIVISRTGIKDLINCMTSRERIVYEYYPLQLKDFICADSSSFESAACSDIGNEIYRCVNTSDGERRL